MTMDEDMQKVLRILASIQTMTEACVNYLGKIDKHLQQINSTRYTVTLPETPEPADQDEPAFKPWPDGYEAHCPDEWTGKQYRELINKAPDAVSKDILPRELAAWLMAKWQFKTLSDVIDGVVSDTWYPSQPKDDEWLHVIQHLERARLIVPRRR
jgi:hypothetical protein